MQRILNSLLGLSLIFLVVFSTGCGEDGGTGGANAIPPSIFLASGDDLVSFDTSVPLLDGSFFVSVDVNDGDEPLNSLTITEDGTTIPAATNLIFDGGATTAQNPLLIVGADASGTIYNIEIIPTDLIANETRTYVFTVADTEGTRSTATVAVTFAAAPPTITVMGNNGLESGDDISTATSSFDVTTTAAEGDFALSSVAVYEDGVLLPADNVAFVSGGVATPFITNPEINVDNQLNFGSGTIRVSPVSTAEGLRTYTFEVTDIEGGVANTIFDVNFVAPQVDVLMGVLLNQAGPQGQGGLDLDDGNGNINSTSTLAEIKDEGINALSGEVNWKQQISGANGATLVRIDAANQPDGFDFDSVISYQEVIDAYNAGAPITVTSFLTGGEIFGVLRDGNYYLFRIADVDVVAVPIGTPGGNADNYTIDIINEAN